MALPSLCWTSSEVIDGLEVEPEARRGAEIPGETEGGAHADAASAVDDFGDARLGNAGVHVEPARRDFQRAEEFFGKDFAGMDVARGLIFLPYG